MLATSQPITRCQASVLAPMVWKLVHPLIPLQQRGPLPTKDIVMYLSGLTIFQVSSMQLFMKQNMPENQLAPRMNLSNGQLNLASASRTFELTTESKLLSCFGIPVKNGNKTSHSVLLVPTGKMAWQKASLALQLTVLVLFYYMPCLNGLMLYMKTCGLSLSIMLLISTIHPCANIKRIHCTNYSLTKIPFGH
jgi:hypothetical protein